MSFGFLRRKTNREAPIAPTTLNTAMTIPAIAPEGRLFELVAPAYALVVVSGVAVPVWA